MRAGRVALCFALAGVALRAQTPVRDQARVTAIGTARISGVVVTDDEARAPVRRATVNLSRTGVEDIRSVATNDDGSYSFERLPAGAYSLSVSKGGYISMSYGAAKPGMPGSPIAVAEDQQLIANPVPLIRGAVIAGRVVDANGRPVELASVRAEQIITIGNERRRRTSSGASASATTNGHGEYRIYPLLPGEYAVSAVSPPIFMQSEMTSAELVAAAQGLPSEPKPRKIITPVPTMFPGTADAGSGIPVVVSRGEERLGVDFAIQYLSAARVTGTVTGVDGRPAAGAVVFCQLKNSGGLLQPTGLPISTADAAGGFTCPGLPPAQYLFVARLVPPAQPGAASAPPLYGLAEVGVAGQDVSGISIRLQTGFTVTGQIVVKKTTATTAADYSRLLLRLVPLGATAVGPPAPAVIDADGSFRIDGVFPGSYRMAAPAPVTGVGTWSLRSAVVGGKDVADTPIEISGHTAGVVVTVTDTQAEVSGAITDGQGRPAPPVYVIVFPSDKALWIPGSRRVLSTRSSDTGAYKLLGLPPGDYYLCALAELETAIQSEPAYLEQMVAASVKFTVGEDEKKRQDLVVK